MKAVMHVVCDWQWCAVCGVSARCLLSHEIGSGEKRCVCFSDACHSCVCLQVPSTPFLNHHLCLCCCPNHHMPLKSGSHQSADHGSHNQSSTFPSASQILAPVPCSMVQSSHFLSFLVCLCSGDVELLSFTIDHHHHQVTGMFQHHSNLAALIHQSDVHFANTFHHCQWSTPHCLPSASSSSGLLATSITPDHQH